MFAYRVYIMLTYEYPIIWVNTNSICLLNGLRFFNPNMTHLLNGLIVSTYLSDFIKMKKKKIVLTKLNYEKPKKKKKINIKFRTNE